MPLVIPPRLPADARDRLAALADHQWSVATRRQLAAAGLSDDHVDGCLSAQRWQEPAPGVLVLHNGPFTVPQRWSVAVAAGGRLCGLAARTAAQAGGLAGWERDVVEVVVPRGTTYPAVAGVRVKVHESRRFTEADLMPAVWPPRVRIERALVDAAVWSTTVRTACGVLAAGVQQRLTVASWLREELDAAGKVRHRKVLAAALLDIEGGAHAVTELDFLRFCRRHGFPRPVMQASRVDSGGRRRYLDATFVRPDGRLVRVEIDGALHLLVRTYWQDMSRGNDLVIDGETVLRFPSFVIHADDAAAVTQLRRALDLSGRGRVASAAAS